MATPKDKPRRLDSGLTTDHGKAGQVESDSGGNRVWRWAKDVLDSTSILLKKLDNQDLALEPTQKVPVMGSAKAKDGKPQHPAKKRVELSIETAPGERDKVGGFDPYNSR